jgi:transposase-like protein
VSEKNNEVDCRGTSLEQRRALVAAYLRDRNMAAAMRETGIRSPRTAYLWWHRYQQAGDAGLAPRSRARKSQRTVPSEIAAEIQDLRRTHPDWGRRRIADEIAARHGVGLVSPSGVEAVLRRSDLWPSAERLADVPAATAIAVPPRTEYADVDALLPLIVRGIEASFLSQAASGVAILGDQVWSRLGSDRHRWTRLLADPAIGPLLLRSRIQLGHSLMNTGRWREAAQILDETLGWLRRAQESREPQSPDPLLGIWLRRDDAWIETYQYLGIVLRQSEPAIARGYFHIALAAVRSSSRRLVPLHPALIEGNLERDIARHMLRVDVALDTEIEHHLHTSRDALENVGDQAMLAATDMAWADLQSRRARRLHDEDQAAWTSAIESMEAATERALRVFETLDSPMLHANFLTDAMRLAVAHGLPLDRQRLRRAALHCLAYGYGGQARQLIELPGVEHILSSDELHALVDIAHRAEPHTTRPTQGSPGAW